MQNREMRDLVSCLRCGIGDKFDIDKLYFNRINIFTDADIDGLNISAGILAFFYKFMRPIIEKGYLYKVYSPLYRLDDKEQPYVANKSEMIEIYHKKITKNYKVRPAIYDKAFSKEEFREFLNDTYDYSENLIRAHKESGMVNKFLIELIISNLVILGLVKDEFNYTDIDEVFSNQKYVKEIMKVIQKKYKEIIVDNTGRFTGVVEGKYTVIKISPRFYKKTSDLIPIINKYGYKLIVKENDKPEKEMTIGEFLDDCIKYTPKIISRFKGLGELNGSQLKQTTLDINNRISVQYTVDDVEKELATFLVTHGNSKEDALARKQMMKKFKIRREDLDN